MLYLQESEEGFKSVIFRSSLDKVAGVSDRSDPHSVRTQLYALSVSELEEAVQQVARLWKRRAGVSPDIKEGLTSQFLNRPLASLHSRLVNPINFQLTWTAPSTMDYRTRSVPRVLLDPETVPDLEQLPFPVPVIDHRYCVVASQFAKLSYFSKLWENEGVLKERSRAQTAAMLSDYRERYAAYEQMLAAGHRVRPPSQPDLPPDRPRLPHKSTLVSYYESRIRHHLVILLKAGAWVDSPEADPTLTPDQAACYSRLNAVFSATSLGRQSGLRFASNPGPTLRYVRKSNPQ